MAKGSDVAGRMAARKLRWNRNSLVLAEVIAEPVAVSQTLSRPHRQDAGHKEFLVIIEHGPRADQGEQQCKAGGEWASSGLRSWQQEGK